MKRIMPVETMLIMSSALKSRQTPDVACVRDLINVVEAFPECRDAWILLAELVGCFDLKQSVVVLESSLSHLDWDDACTVTNLACILSTDLGDWDKAEEMWLLSDDDRLLHRPLPADFLSNLQSKKM
jgi:hypothetical protein